MIELYKNKVMANGSIFIEIAKSNTRERKGLFICTCGNKYISSISKVNANKIKSCGCAIKNMVKANTTHGLTKHPLYKTYNSMINRCNNKQSKDYKSYGGRGIKICERWKKIENFIEDMYPTYIKGLSLDRIDVNGNYEPDNCRWADNFVQTSNIRILKTNNTSGYKGVTKQTKGNKIRARITINNKQIHIGTFNTKLEAAKAYDQYIKDNNLPHTPNGVLE